MHPILLTTAASAAGDIIQTLAERFASGPAKTAASAAPAVPFSTLIDQANAPTAATSLRRVQDLSTRLGRCAEVAGVINEAGVSGPLKVQVDAHGAAALRLPDGSLRSIPLSEEMRGVARELHQLGQAGGARPASPVTISIG